MPTKKTTTKKATTKKATTKKTTTKKATTKKATTTTTKKTVKKATPKTAKVIDLNATVGSALGFQPYQQKKSEDYMSPEMLAHFADILHMWRNQLMEEVDSTVTHMKEEAANLPDPVDRAALEEGFNLELRTRDRERKLIRKIEKSLNEIQEREYGYCEDCGVEIGVRRLEARPTANKCIDCKTYQEIRERQDGK